MKKKVTKKDTKKQKQLLEKKLDKAWSDYVRKRANGVCEKCGGHSTLQAHHAFGRRHHYTRWDVDNGVGLDYACHIHWAHHDPSGFTEWFRKKVGEEKYSRLAEIHNKPFIYDNECLEKMLDWFYENTLR